MTEPTARDQLVARYEHHLFGDGRELARPGDDDLIFSAAGVIISDLEPQGDGSVHRMRFDFQAATGYYRPCGQGLPVGFTGQPLWMGVGFSTPPGDGWTSSTLLNLTTWAEHGWPVEVYAALGKWTFMWCEAADRRSRYVVFPTLIPPAPGFESGPEQPVTELDAGRTLFIPVSMVLPPESGEGEGYLRTWFVPRQFADDLAAMMTHRFGVPGESMVNPDAAREVEQRAVTPLPGGWDDWIELFGRQALFGDETTDENS